MALTVDTASPMTVGAVRRQLRHLSNEFLQADVRQFRVIMDPDSDKVVNIVLAQITATDPGSVKNTVGKVVDAVVSGGWFGELFFIRNQDDSWFSLPTPPGQTFEDWSVAYMWVIDTIVSTSNARCVGYRIIRAADSELKTMFWETQSADL